MTTIERQPVIMADKNKLFGFIDQSNFIPLMLIVCGVIGTWSYVNFSVDQLHIDLNQEVIDRKDADEELAKHFRLQFQKYEAVQIENQKEIREEFRALREASQLIQRDLTQYIINEVKFSAETK